VGVVSNHMFEHSIGKMMALVFYEMKNLGIKFHLFDQVHFPFCLMWQQEIQCPSPL
jgi:hypothetical protein